MKEIWESGYKYPGIVEVDKIKETGEKDKVTSKCKRRLKLLLFFFLSKLNDRKEILAINT